MCVSEKVCLSKKAPSCEDPRPHAWSMCAACLCPCISLSRACGLGSSHLSRAAGRTHSLPRQDTHPLSPSAGTLSLLTHALSRAAGRCEHLPLAHTHFVSERQRARSRERQTAHTHSHSRTLSVRRCKGVCERKVCVRKCVLARSPCLSLTHDLAWQDDATICLSLTV